MNKQKATLSASIYSQENLSTQLWKEYGIITESSDRCFIHGMCLLYDMCPKNLFLGLLAPLLL